MATTQKIQKIVGIVTIAMLFTVALPAVVMASPPVPSPNSTAGITSTTDIVCYGTVRETVSYHSTWSTEDLNTGLMDEERVGDIQYDSSLSAVKGDIEYSKSFSTNGANAPNLVVERKIGFVADNTSTISGLDATENVGMSIISEGDSNQAGQGAGALCVWAQDACIPPSCTDVAAGSQLSGIKVVSAETKATVSATESPRLDYTIDAHGVNGVGTYTVSDGRETWLAEGDIAAGMKVSTSEGRTCTHGTLGPYPKAGTLSYSDVTTANGRWTFQKSMSYQSQIPSAGIPGLWPVFQ
ncbi:MAG: hypothetical protein WAV32_05515 [Halobacteriota archaeon]